MTKLVLTMFISLSMYTLIMYTPITMGITILLMAMFTAVMFATSMSSWMAFLIFMIYISGTLIMFAYFVAMAPNKTMYFTAQIPMIMSTPIMVYLLTEALDINYVPSEYFLQSNTFYTTPTMVMLILMALILLLTMIIVVKISASSKGPLRPFN